MTARLNTRAVWLYMGILALVALAAAYQAPSALRIDVGSAGDSASLDGFYFPETQNGTTFRWSGPDAAITFTGTGARSWRLRMRAAGLRPAGPAAVTLSANGELLASFDLGGEMSEVAASIPRSAFGPSGNLRLQLRTTGFMAPPDQRDLGIMVDWLELEPEGWDIVTPPPGVLLGLWLAAILCAGAWARLGYRTRLAPAAGTAMALGLAVLVVWDRSLAARYVPWLLAGLLVLAIAGQRVRKAAWWEWLAWAALAWSAYRFGTRAVDFFRNGLPPGDFSIYYEAARQVREGGQIYNWQAAHEMPNGPVYKYPPLFAILLAPLTVWPARSVAAIWYLFNLALLGLMFAGAIWQARRVDRRAAVPFAYLLLIGLLNFQPVWESLARGQMDVIILASMVAALALLRSRQGAPWAGISLAFASMLKLYPGLLVLYLILRRRWRAVAGFAAGFLALAALSGIVVGWSTLWRYVTEILSVQTAAVPWPENQSFDGLISRLVVPAAATTWYTTIPFARPALFALYALDAIAGLASVWTLWRSGAPGRRAELAGYACLIPLIVMAWPTAWIHYQTLLALPFTALLWHILRHREPKPVIAAAMLAFLLVAIGNEYTVLVAALATGWPRLLQSYKLYGVLVLWALLLRLVWQERRQDERQIETLTDRAADAARPVWEPPVRPPA